VQRTGRRRHELDDDGVRAFHQTGWVVLDGLFDGDEVAAMRESFDRLELLAERLGSSADVGGARFVVDPAAEGRPPRIRRIVWCGAVEPRLLRLGRDARLLRPVARLLGSPEMDHLINQAHFKRPGDGVAFPWHQDSSRRRWGSEWRDVTGRGSYVQVVVAVDDVTADNGPLRLIPGSGRLGHLDLPDGRLDLAPSGLADETEAVAATMHAGDALLFGPYTIHGSEPNRSAAPRRVLINGFAAPGANSRVYPGSGLGVRVRAPL